METSVGGSGAEGEFYATQSMVVIDCCDECDCDEDEYLYVAAQGVAVDGEGEIDLLAIDENGDGKVFQDQMCWNVISDESGECPQCGMILKEVSLEDTKINLEDNGYEVKTE